jgi:two-component system, LytTR family, response regulator
MPYRALLIDDERLARKQLRTLLASFPEVEVVAEACAVPEALAAVEEYQPEVVFLDIQMPGSSGFDFLASARGRFSTIFVTAHDRFALRAFEVNGLDYLLKPVEPDRLARAVRRLAARSVVGDNPSSPLSVSDYLFVSGALSSRFVRVEQILYVLAAGPYSEIFVDDGSRWMMSRSITEWQARLPKGHFVRIHRSTIVNLNFVDRVEPLPNYSCAVWLRGAKGELIMSRRRASLIKERFS